MLFARIVALTRACRALSCALFRVCHSHALLHVVCVHHMCHLHVSLASPRVDHVCHVAFARDNKLFSFKNTHVNNVNLLGHIF